MKNKGMYLGKFTYANGGLVRMEPGGPGGSSFQPSYDTSKSYAENMELNKRAQAAGHNSVAEYEKSGWAWQPKQAQAAQPKQQQPASFYENPKGNTLENSGYPYQSDGSQANKTWAEKVIYQPRTEFEQKKAAEQERLGRERWEQQRRSPAYTDHAGLPSVPIFESLLMAPVALGEAGLAGLARAVPAVGSALWEGAGTLGSSIYEGGAALAGEIGQGFNTVKNFAKPAVDAWNTTLNTKLLGDAAIGASTGETVLANLATPANLLKAWGFYDLTNKYAPEAVENAQLYNETGDTKYLKDAAYNTGKGLLESFSHTGPIVHEVQALKKPISFVDDARKMLDADKDVASRSTSGFKTFKNTMGLLKEKGGDISVPNLKRVKIKALPKNWKSQ